MIEALFFSYIICLGATAIVSFHFGASDGFVKILYWFFSAPLLLFTIFRPIGLARDDDAYLSIFDAINSDSIGAHIISIRDPLWYLVAFVGKSLWADVRVLLLISAMGLLIKLMALGFAAGRNKLLALLMYACIYWQLHDLSQLRVSLSMAFFIVFLYLMSIQEKRLASITLVISSLFHIQALANLLLLIKRPAIKRFTVSVAGALVVGVIFLGFYPSLDSVSDVLINSLGVEAISRLFGSYYIIADSDGDAGGFNPPLIFIASVFCYGIAIAGMGGQDFVRPMFQISARSILYAIGLAWLFASLSDVQVRFYEYYFAGGLFLTGQIKSKISFYSLACLSALYFAKFNLLWKIWDVAILNAWLS